MNSMVNLLLTVEKSNGLTLLYHFFNHGRGYMPRSSISIYNDPVIPEVCSLHY